MQCIKNLKTFLFTCILLSSTYCVDYSNASTPDSLVRIGQISMGHASLDSVVGDVDSQGNLHFVFTVSGMHTYYQMETSDGQVLINATQITNPGIHKVSHLDITIDDFDVVHIVWLDTSGSHKLTYTALKPLDVIANGTSFDDANLSYADDFKISAYNGSQMNEPALGVDDLGNAHVVWIDYYDPLGELFSTPQIYYAMLSINQNTSSAEYMIFPTMLTSTITYKGNPDVAIDANNRPHIVWDDSRNSEVEWVLIGDSSGSMFSAWGDFCVLMYGGNFASGGFHPGLKNILQGTDITLYETLYVLHNPIYTPAFPDDGSCQPYNFVNQGIRSTPLDHLDESGGLRYLSETVYNNQSFVGQAPEENWGPGTNWACLSWKDTLGNIPGNASTALDHKWNQNAKKYVIPFSDEGPLDGDPSQQVDDTSSILEAHNNCVNAGVIPVGLLPPTYGAGQSIQSHMLDLSQCPNGVVSTFVRNCPGHSVNLTNAGGHVYEFPTNSPGPSRQLLTEALIHLAINNSREIQLTVLDPYHWMNTDPSFVIGNSADTLVNGTHVERLGSFVHIDDTLLTNDSSNSLHPSIDFDQDNNLHLAWMDGRAQQSLNGSVPEIFHAVYNISTNQTDGVPNGLNLSNITVYPPQVVSEVENNTGHATSAYPSLLVSEDEKIHITWVDFANTSATHEISYVTFNQTDLSVNQSYSRYELSTWNSSKSVETPPHLFGSAGSTYVVWTDSKHCNENQGLNVTSICYAELVQRNLEFTLKEYESSEKDAIPGQQIVFDFWLNNSVPTLDAQFDDIITIDTSILPQYWSTDLRFTNNQTLISDGDSLFIEAGGSHELSLYVETPSIYEATENETLLYEISAVSQTSPSLSDEIEMSVDVIVERGLEISSIANKFVISQGDSLNNIPIQVKSQSNVAETYRFFDAEVNATEWNKPEHWSIDFPSHVNLEPDASVMLNLSVHVPAYQDAGNFTLYLSGWSDYSGYSVQATFALSFEVIWEKNNHIFFEMKEHREMHYAIVEDCFEFEFRATKNFGSGMLYFEVHGAENSESFTSNPNAWNYSIENSSANTSVNGGMWYHEHQIPGEWIHLQVCAPSTQIASDYPVIEIKSVFEKSPEVNATLVLNFTRYQESIYLLSEPVPQQRVFTPMVNLSGALVSNQYSGPVQIEFSTELSTFYLSGEEKTVFSQVNMYDNVVLPSPQNFNLSIDISSKIVSKISSNLTVFVLISDEKSSTLETFSIEYFPDQDRDGYSDDVDMFPLNASEWIDSDLDNFGDNFDAFPDDITEWLDSDGDGYGDNVDKFPFDSLEWSDRDGDGVGDNSDLFPDDADISTLADITDTDQDGVIDIYDVCSGTLPSTYVDDEGCIIDQDSDGVDDLKDQCPNTARNVEVNAGGCEVKEEVGYVENLMAGDTETIAQTVGMGAIIIAILGFMQSNLAAALLPDTFRWLQFMKKKSKLSTEEELELRHLQSIVQAYASDVDALQEEFHMLSLDLTARYTNSEIKKETREKINTLIEDLGKMNEEGLRRIAFDDRFFGFEGTTKMRERNDILSTDAAMFASISPNMNQNQDWDVAHNPPFQDTNLQATSQATSLEPNLIPGPEIQSNAGINEGYEWLQYEGSLYYRMENSHAQWTKR